MFGKNQAVATVEPQAEPTAGELIQIAIEKGNVPIEQMRELLAFKRECEKDQARKAFTQAMSAFKAEPPEIRKNKHVSFPTRDGATEYDHATLDHVCDAIGAAMSRHGLSFRWDTKQHENKEIEVTCIVEHALGHAERTSLKAYPDDSGKKNAIQQVGSAVHYLQRYTLLSAVGLAPKGVDDDGRGTGGYERPGTISAEQKQQIVDKMRETGADDARFRAYFEIETLDDLPAGRIGEAMHMLKQKGEKKQ